MLEIHLNMTELLVHYAENFVSVKILTIVSKITHIFLLTFLAAQNLSQLQSMTLTWFQTAFAEMYEFISLLFQEQLL